MKLYIEHTDTFGREANYSWVNRIELKLDDSASNRTIVRQAKKALGITGLKCKTYNYGDLIELRPIGMCQVIFITFG